MNAQALIAAITESEWNTLFLALGLLCLGGAAWMGYKQSVPGVILLVGVAIVAIVVGADI